MVFFTATHARVFTSQWRLRGNTRKKFMESDPIAATRHQLAQFIITLFAVFKTRPNGITCSYISFFFKVCHYGFFENPIIVPIIHCCTKEFDLKIAQQCTFQNFNEEEIRLPRVFFHAGTTKEFALWSPKGN